MRYREDDFAAFKILYERYSSKVYGYLVNKQISKDFIEDVFQQIFAKLHKVRRKYVSDIPVEAWVFTIARSIVLDFYRKEKSQNRNQEFQEQQMNRNSNEFNRNEPELHLHALSAGDQNLIQMKYVDEYSYDEIAKIVGLSSTTVRQRVSRGLKKLRERLLGGLHV